MGKSVGIYHRFSNHGIGECVLYEPIPKNFVWISMYVEPERRCGNVPHLFFQTITQELSGIHHIHCNIRIRPFLQLCKIYKWKPKGDSQYFENCSYYLYHSTRSRNKPGSYIEMKHEMLKRRPTFRSVLNVNHSKQIVDMIRENFRKRR